MSNEYNLSDSISLISARMTSAGFTPDTDFITDCIDAMFDADDMLMEEDDQYIADIPSDTTTGTVEHNADFKRLLETVMQILSENYGYAPGLNPQMTACVIEGELLYEASVSPE